MFTLLRNVYMPSSFIYTNVCSLENLCALLFFMKYKYFYEVQLDFLSINEQLLFLHFTEFNLVGGLLGSSGLR